MYSKYLKALIAIPLIVIMMLACNHQKSEAELSGIRLITHKPVLDIAKGENALFIENVSKAAKNINWSVSELPAWLDVYPSEGMLAVGEKQLLRFSFQPTDSTGLYKTQVELELDNGFAKTIQFESNYQGCVDTSSASNTHIQPQALHLSSNRNSQEILVKFKNTTDRKAVLADYAHYKLRLKKAGSGSQADILLISEDEELVDKELITTLVNALNQDERIQYAEVNTTLELLSNTSNLSTINRNDPGIQWHLGILGVPEGWKTIDVQKQLKQKPVIVAVIDSGFDLDHEDLAANLVPGCDFMGTATKVDNIPGLLSTVGTRDYYHGTHVAGIVAAMADNKQGVSGLSYLSNVRVQPIKLFRDDGQAPRASDAVDAIRWAAGLEVEGLLPNPTPADIINFSIGQADPSEALEKVVNDVTEAGKIFVASSGNQGRSNGIMYPSAVENAIAVGSLDSTLVRSEFSNYNQAGRTVDVVAPGGSGTSAHDGSSCSGILSTYPENQYACSKGTSMATPYVSSVLAMIWAKHPEWSSKKVTEHLFESSYFDISWQLHPQQYGRGVPMLDKALGTTK